MPAWAGRGFRGKLGAVDKTVKVFSNFADAERADEEYYASITPAERIEILLELIERHRSSFGPAAERLERVYRVTELAKS